eukprot:1061120-Rhodomonas_salina.1
MIIEIVGNPKPSVSTDQLTCEAVMSTHVLHFNPDSSNWATFTTAVVRFSSHGIAESGRIFPML